MTFPGRLFGLGLILSVVLAGTARAGVNEWTSIGPGGGAAVSALAIDPANPSIAYAGAIGGVFKSVDGGASWTLLNRGLADPGVTPSVSSLAIDPTSPSVVYAVSRQQVFRSADGGRSWTRLAQPVESSGSSRSIAVLPDSTATVLTGTTHGLFLSADGGKTWTRTRGLAKSVLCLAVDLTRPSTIYAGSDADGVFKSTDGGASFSASDSSIAGLRIPALAVDPTAPSLVYASANTGIFKSSNGGASWARASDSSDVQALVVDSLAAVYAGRSLGGVLRSSDAGATWTSVNDGLGINSLSLASVTAITASRDGSEISVATSDGVFKKAASEESWTALNGGLCGLDISIVVPDPLSPSALYAVSSRQGSSLHKFYKTADGGASWTRADQGLPVDAGWESVSLAIGATTPATLFTASGTIFRTTDGGENWAVTFQDDGKPITLLAAGRSNPATVYASYLYHNFFSGRTDAGIVRSRDGGDHWSEASGGLPGAFQTRALVVDPDSASTAYVSLDGVPLGVQARGVYKTTDGGSNWVNVWLSVPTMLVIDPTNSSALYAVFPDKQIFRSADRGTTWSVITGPPGGCLLTALVVAPTTPATLYAATPCAGVFRSPDGGSTWTAVNDGLPNYDVESLAANPESPWTLYAGTSGNSLFEITFSDQPSRPPIASPPERPPTRRLTPRN